MRRFRVLADPTRIKLLDQLRRREASVQELTETIGSTQQNVSKHLGVLLQALSAPDEEAKGAKPWEEKKEGSEPEHGHSNDHDHPPKPAKKTPWWKKVLGARKAA